MTTTTPTAALPSLADASVLVVGGSSGIGLAVAGSLAAAGANVTIAARSKDGLTRAASSLGGHVRTAIADITDQASLQALFSGIGPLDHVYVSAGTFAIGPILETPSDTARPSLDERIWGAYDLSRLAVPVLRPGGSLTFTSGITAGKAMPGAAAPAAANAGLEAFVRTLAIEIAPLRANVVRPGPTDTPWFRAAFGVADDAQLAAAGAAALTGRVATAHETAAAVLFLMTNPAVTGTVIAVDGGLSLA
jgi:NAD(P)-dependent dehydrogenase (short-subunit alcohol dehydrogenase family)